MEDVEDNIWSVECSRNMTVLAVRGFMQYGKICYNERWGVRDGVGGIHIIVEIILIVKVIVASKHT